MYSIPIPKLSGMPTKTNTIGLSLADYQGGLSTLCGGCGHDSITSAIIQTLFELAIPPHRIAKLSGIGCSSKTPGYFVSQAHGFNSVHGRMPTIATGANCAERDMTYLAVSGDGDSGSIGLGHFAHIVRRGINMLYIVENNGVYGLTKGQFSALADPTSKTKSGEDNLYNAIDLATLAIELGASFVARSFSGNKQQLVPLLKAGLNQPGFSFIDVLSPCVSFNNHQGSTRSYQYIRDHEITSGDIADFVPPYTEITSPPLKNNQQVQIELHDGSRLCMYDVQAKYSPYDRKEALAYLRQQRESEAIATGLLYLDHSPQDFHQTYGTTTTALRDLDFEELCPGSSTLEKINAQLR